MAPNNNHDRNGGNNNNGSGATVDELSSSSYDYLVTLAFHRRGNKGDAIRACSSLLNVLDKQVFDDIATGNSLQRLVSVAQDRSGPIYIHMMIESAQRANPDGISEHDFLQLIRYVWERLAGLDWADEETSDGAVQIFATDDCPERTADLTRSMLRTTSAAVHRELAPAPMHTCPDEFAPERSREGTQGQKLTAAG